jgi:hypothetical protein
VCIGVTMPMPWVSRHRISDVIQRRSGNVTAIRVPTPGGVWTSRSPPSAATRSRRPKSPLPSARASDAVVAHVDPRGAVLDPGRDIRVLRG